MSAVPFENRLENAIKVEIVFESFSRTSVSKQVSKRGLKRPQNTPETFTVINPNDNSVLTVSAYSEPHNIATFSFCTTVHCHCHGSDDNVAKLVGPERHAIIAVDD
jgi:hypothetical protein